MISRLLAAVVVLACLWPARAQDAAGVEFFEAKVRPLLVEHCMKCHGETKQRGGLRLDSKAAWEKGGDGGQLLVPGKSERSLLIKMVRGGSETPPQMPPDSRLSPDQVATLAKWIDMGAPDPRTVANVAASKSIDWKKAEKFWAFQPIQPTAPPTVKNSAPKTTIDRFVAATLEQKGLAAVGPAEKVALIRRVTFGLTGLPPTRAEVEVFLADKSAEAFAKVIDRLLASPRYGEHQARFWLDLARYGEDQAHTLTKEGNVHAWRYRDWVIDAFNRDLPYDQFVKFQIAADLLGQETKDPRNLAALGLFGLGPIYFNNNEPLKGKADQLDDRVDTLTRAFLALTVSCARCHDHKFDPIPTIDYYSLAGIFGSTTLAEVRVAPKVQVDAFDAARKTATEADQIAKDFVQDEKDRLSRQFVETLPDTIVAIWIHHANTLDEPQKANDVSRIPAGKLDKEGVSRMMKYLGRKDTGNRALSDWAKLLPKKDGPREPSVEVRKLADTFCQSILKNLDTPFSKRNLDMQNDLFGKKGVFPVGYDDVLTNTPTHRLTAWRSLKAEAMEAWAKVPSPPPLSHGITEDAKPAHMKVALRGNPYKPGEVAPRRFLRVIGGEDRPVFSEGSGRLQLAEAIADPKNPVTPRVMVNRIWQQHFGRGLVGTPSNFGELGERPSHPELLDYLADQFVKQGWSIKKLHREILLTETYQRSSAILAKNQEIDPENRLLWRVSRRRVAVEGYRDSLLAASGQLDLVAGGPSANLDDVKNIRRTVYGKVSRLDLSQLLRLFDFPDANITSDRRTETTVPQQLLFAINSPFAMAQAKGLASRLSQETPAAKVREAYWFVFSRPATEAEITLGVRYLAREDTLGPTLADTLTRLERFAQALLASNEFVYID